MSVLIVWKENLTRIQLHALPFMGGIIASLRITTSIMLHSWFYWFGITVALVSTPTLSFFFPYRSFIALSLYCFVFMMALSLLAARPSLVIKDHIYELKLMPHLIISTIVSYLFLMPLLLYSFYGIFFLLFFAPFLTFFTLFLYDNALDTLCFYRITRLSLYLVIQLFPLVAITNLTVWALVTLFVWGWHLLFFINPFFLSPIVCIFCASFYSIFYSFFTQNIYKVVS